MATAAKRRRVGLLVVVGLLGAFGPFGTDMYLPALPELGRELRADDAATQLTLVAYLVGLGAGQLVWGPLSDRIGRRAPILIGTTGFAIASLACALAPDIAFLVPMRLIQGLLGAAGVAVGRAVIRDLYDGADLTRILSRLTIVFGLAPVVAPVVGGAILTFTGWRGTFFILLGLGVLLVVATLIWVPETLDAAHRVHGRSAAGAPDRLTQGDAWRALVRSRQFLRYAIVAVISMIGLFAYISAVSLVLQQEWGLDPTTFALWFAVNAAAGIIGGQTGGWLVRHVPTQRMLPIAIAINAAAGSLVVAAGALGGPFWLLELGLLLAMFAFMAGAPLAISLALAPFTRGAGTASAALGAAQFVLGSVPPVLIALAFGTSTIVMGITMLAAAIVAILIAIPWRPRAAAGERPH